MKAIIDSASSISADTIRVSGVLVDELAGFKQAFNVDFTGKQTEDSIKNALIRISESSQSQDLVKKLLSPGTEIDLTPSASVPPTKEDLERLAFLRAQIDWRSAKLKIADGTIPADDPDALALLKNLQDLYKPIYIALG